MLKKAKQTEVTQENSRVTQEESKDEDGGVG